LVKNHSVNVIADEKVLNWLGYHFLFWWDYPQEALMVFKLITRLFPKSPNAWDSLGEAYLFLGDQENAIKSYKKSLKLNPNNKNAESLLKKLTEEKNKQ
jgi:tetratricopeptide (TPR) repeat protein